MKTGWFLLVQEELWTFSIFHNNLLVSVSQKNETQQVIQQQQQQIIHITLAGHQNSVHYVAYTSYTVHGEYLRNKCIMISEKRA